MAFEGDYFDYSALPSEEKVAGDSSSGGVVSQTVKEDKDRSFADDIPVDAVRDFTSPDGRLHSPAGKDVVDLTSLTADGSAEESGSEDEDSSGNRHVGAIDASDGNGGSGQGGSVEEGGSDADPYAVTDAMRAEATAGSDAEIKTLEDYLKSVKAPETEADRKKRERRERAKKVISAVGDGLSAIGNLIFTTQYAPNMYNPQNSAVEKTLGSIERARKEREANLDAYMKYSLALGKAKGERAKTLRELEAEMEKRKQAAEKARQAAETHAFEKSLWPDKQAEQAGKTIKAENEGKIAKTKAEYAPQQLEAELNLTKEKTKTEKTRQTANSASAANSLASADEHRSAAEKNRKGDYIDVEDSSGKIHRIYDSDLDNLYMNVPEAVKEKFMQYDGHNFSKTPTTGEMRKAVAYHLKTLNKKHSPTGNKKPSPTGNKKPSPTGKKKSPTA
ncbi:MAG: hypothetical protein K2M56_06000 [Muribaculaceae bacterium]|nr:hypothetical protein [Muribaculaceae bacterium]